MKCLHCDNSHFEVKECRFNPEIKGVKVDVVALAMVCTKCHAPLMNDEQMDNLRKASAVAYRRNTVCIINED